MSKKLSNKSEHDILNTPCTIAEATQIAFGASRDVLEDYTTELSKLIVQQTLVIETLKSLLMLKGMITKDELEKEYVNQAGIYTKEKLDYMESLRSSKKGVNKDEFDASSDSESTRFN